MSNKWVPTNDAVNLSKYFVNHNHLSKYFCQEKEGAK